MSAVSRCFLAMGTYVAIAVPCSPRRRRRAAAAVDEIQQAMAGFGHDAWAFGGGELARVNRTLLGGGVAAVPARLRPLFARAWALRELTGGRFEPRLGALVRLWGFDGVAQSRAALPGASARARALAALRRAPAYDGSAHYGPAPGVAWDFGGIGKGYIVDLALAHLRERGFAGASIDAGGHIATRGERGARPWRVGIRAPGTRAVRLVATLDACNEAIVTHGQDQRCFTHRARRYGHLLDPATGAPAAGLRSLTVVHADGALADAAGAALFVAGARWPALAAAWGLDRVLAVTAGGALYATPALAPRLRPPPDISGEASWTQPIPIAPEGRCSAAD